MMNDMKIDNKKIAIWGAIIILLQMGVYSAIWLNPYVSSIFLQFADNPAVKPYDYFGGLDNWIQIRMIYNVIFLAVLIKVFLMFYENIPGSGWKKGVCFGLIITLVKTVPEAFNKWTLIVYPEELIILQLVNGALGLVIFGVLVATTYGRFFMVNEKAPV